MKNPFTLQQGLEPPMIEAALFWIGCVVVAWVFVCGIVLTIKYTRRKNEPTP